MDERTLESAAATTQRHLDEARERLQEQKKYTILVRGGKFEENPLVLSAINAEDRTRQMRANGIDPNRHNWAAAQHKGRGYEVCGNDEEAKRLLYAHLRKS